MKGKGKFKMIITVLVIAIAVGLGGALILASGEQREAKNLPIAAIDFKKLNDGTYIGEYEGGMYKWRTNKAQVAVSSGKVTDIKLLSSAELKSKEPGAKLGNMDQNLLYSRVIEAQSLQVDTISGATLTSKACLKSVEAALVKAQKGN